MKKKLIAAILGIVLVLFGAAGVFAYCWTHTQSPKLYFYGDISGMESKKDVRQISFAYDDGTSRQEGYAEIKIQGSSSIYYEKKNYTLKFFEDENLENKLKLDVGWGPQNKYCMKANWIDRTHARNVVTARLSAQMQAKYGLLAQAPNNGLIDGFPVEIYHNDEFMGLYTFNIPKDAWQFAMDDDNPNHIVVAGETWEDPALFKAMPDFENWSVEVGEESDYTMERLNRLFDFVINSSDDEFKARFEEYLNLDSTLNYYIMSDVAYLEDNRAKNMLLATYDGLEWYLSLYDLDTSWGTNIDGLEVYPYQEHTIYMNASRLLQRLEEQFSVELAQRYFELRDDILSVENIKAEFEAFREEIPTLTFIKEARNWGNGRIGAESVLPGRDYDQIWEYLEVVPAALDEKYSAWLEQ